MSPAVSNSLWSDTAGLNRVHRQNLSEDLAVDVAIVGAGFTGLWTAYYLAKRAPQLKVVILEANEVGFGASGRNGGWCSALFPTAFSKLANSHGPVQARRMYDAMVQNISEIQNVITGEEIDCDWTLGGTIVAARNQVQLNRAKAEVAEHRSNGLPESDLQLLTAAELENQAHFSSALGGTFTPHCAAINPAKLVHGLANVVENLGVKIYEQTRVDRIEPNLIGTEKNEVKAKYVVRATEGYTSALADKKREVVPVYSLMVATEPIPGEVWSDLGLANRQTFSDFRNLVIYGQRTTDNRIAFGGRGAPYHFGSRISPGFDQVRKVHELLRRTLVELFPALSEVQITHQWGGALGITRDWMASCGLDPKTGLAWAGGYVGDGVTTSSLAGQTLAALISGLDTPITSLAWVNHQSPKWEPEPLRWLGINSALAAVKFADRVELRRGREARAVKVLNRLIGG